MATDRKRNSVIGHSINEATGVITFEVVGAGSFSFDVTKAGEANAQKAAFHGYVQKISDKAAIGRDPDTGRSASPKEKYDAMHALAKHLEGGGTWSMRAAVKAVLDRAALIQAICTARGFEEAKVILKLAGKLDEELRVYLTARDVAAEYARLTATGAEEEGLFEGLE